MTKYKFDRPKFEPGIKPGLKKLLITGVAIFGIANIWDFALTQESLFSGYTPKQVEEMRNRHTEELSSVVKGLEKIEYYLSAPTRELIYSFNGKQK